MAILNFFNDPHFLRGGSFEVDTGDVFAVRHLGVSNLTTKGYEHRRKFWMRDGSAKEVRVISPDLNSPKEIRVLDELGGKPYVRMGYTGDHHSCNSSMLACFADAVTISTEPADLRPTAKLNQHNIVLDDARSQSLVSCGISGVFTRDGKPTTIAHGTRLHQATLRINTHTLCVGHLDKNCMGPFAPN